MRLLTGEGFWSPLVWLALAVGVAALGAIFWSRGRRDYKAGTEQDVPFLSGERVPEGAHVGGRHLYWGFVEGLRPLLDRLDAFHSGFLGDYVAWFVALLAVAFLVVTLG
ncbi:MAG: hydrogenase [Candidatus Bipolaricaulaceae bacterium]